MLNEGKTVEEVREIQLSQLKKKKPAAPIKKVAPPVPQKKAI